MNKAQGSRLKGKTKKSTRAAPRKTAKKKKPAKAAKARKPAKPISPAQEATQITWLILGELKSTQIKHLRVGKLLCDVRDRKLYVELKFPDMESYAWERLHLRRTAYYQYVQVYDWVAASHPEWLVPHPSGFIPDLNDATDLIWIENELRRADLAPTMRSTLEALRKKALSGTLRFGELDTVRRKDNVTKDALKALLSRVRSVRKRSKELTRVPEEAIAHLDSAIALIEKAFQEERAAASSKQP